MTFDQDGITNIVQQSKKVYKEVEGAVRDQIQKQKQKGGVKRIIGKGKFDGLPIG